jgi:hypothetical protein
MPIDAEKEETLRHAVKQYLRLLASPWRFRKYAAGSVLRNPDTDFIGDSLFTWWSDLINPSHPEMDEVFSVQELESLRRYNAIIRSFHQSSPESKLPILDFIRTDKFQEISNAARDSYKVFKRFWFFTVA